MRRTKLRPLIVFSDVTVDGFMTGPDNDLGYMLDDSELQDELTGMLMSVADTIIVGRRTFPEMGGYWTTANGRLADWMNTTPKVVLSTDGSFDVSSWMNSTLAAGDGLDQVRRLKASAGAGRPLTPRGAKTYPSGTVALHYTK
jgi:dihydrofolate reductase